MSKEIKTDVLIIGAGTAGMFALREVRRAARDFLMIDRGPLGTTCARVGCMPSKAALHAGAQWTASGRNVIGAENREAFAVHLSAAWSQVRAQRDRFAQGAAEDARAAAGENLMMGQARFIEPTLVEVEADGDMQRIRARSVIVATGSRPVMPEFLDPVRENTVNTDEIFELDTLPTRVGILGMGAIGLEMGLAMARLGIDVVGVDLADKVAGIADDAVAQRAKTRFEREMRIWLGAQAEVAPAPGHGIRLSAGDREAEVDLLLAALGRRPNVDGLNLEQAGFPLDEHGNPLFDPHTMQVKDLPVFIAGDANATRPLLHEAVSQGAAAGYNATHEPITRFARQVPISVAFSAPDVVAVGASLGDLDKGAIVTGEGSGHQNGRAIILRAEDSLLRVYADAKSGRLLGAAGVSAAGEHLAQLLAWAIQRGETAQTLLAMPFYHPSMEEMVQSALQEVVKQLPSKSGLPFGLQAAESKENMS